MVSKGAAALYLVKSVRVIMIWLAVTTAARLFESDYVEKVYGRGERPPSLGNLNLVVAISMLVFNALLASTMVLMTTDYGARFGLLSRGYVRIVMVDSLAHTALVLVLGYIITGIVENKKYFAYRKEGVRAIRAVKELILAVSIPFILVPYFISS